MERIFTVNDAIIIQQQQLKRWKSVLKPSKFKLLETWLEIMNKGVIRPNDIKRGVDIDSFIHNELMKPDF